MTITVCTHCKIEPCTCAVRGPITRPDGTVIDLGRSEITVVCPCGQSVTVFELGMLHREPRCSEFEDLDPADYLAWVAKHHGSPPDASKN